MMFRREPRDVVRAGIVLARLHSVKPIRFRLTRTSAFPGTPAPAEPRAGTGDVWDDISPDDDSEWEARPAPSDRAHELAAPPPSNVRIILRGVACPAFELGRAANVDGFPL